MLKRINGIALKAMVGVSVMRARLVSQEAQGEWVSQIMIIGIILIIAAAVFAFWKGGGMTWINTQLNNITTY